MDLEQANDGVHELEKQLQYEQASRVDLSRGVHALAQLCCGFKCILNQALTRMANYEQRVTLTVGHVQSVTGMYGHTHTHTPHTHAYMVSPPSPPPPPPDKTHTCMHTPCTHTHACIHTCTLLSGGMQDVQIFICAPPLFCSYT